MNESLEELRRYLDDLEFEHPEVEPVARAILSRDPADRVAVNALGRTLLARGEPEEALEVYEAGLDADPENTVAANRVREIRNTLVKQRLLRADQERRPRRAPQEIVEPVLGGPGREACLAFLAWSIRAIERIDPTRLAVTDIPSDNRFRVVGGVYSAVTPWHRLLCISVDKTIDPGLPAAVEAAGGHVTDTPGAHSAVPSTIQVGVPYERVGELSERLQRPHVEHLKRSIEWGPPTWARVHDPALRAYLLEQGEA